MAESYAICLDVGGTKVLGVLFNQRREIVYRLKKRFRDRADTTRNTEEVISAVVAEMLEGAGIDRSQVRAVASSAPGVVDQEKGIVLFTPNLPWRDYDMKSALEARFGIPFFLGNDVNLGVLGEFLFGAGRGYRNIVGFFVGTGIGGGLILDGKLYTGNGCKAGELGHMVLDPEGPLCGCGRRGCLEAFAGKQGMAAYIRQELARGRESVMAQRVDRGVFRSKHLKKALAAGDLVAREAVDRACHYLAIATGSVINIFSPDLVLFGGGVMESMGDLFLEKILSETDRYCMPQIRSTTAIKTAALGDDSVLYGALGLIESRLPLP